MDYAYWCLAGHEIIYPEPLNSVACVEHGTTAKRQFRVAVNRSSLRQQGRWDPQVGAYVANTIEFRDLLKQGAERESQSLGMAVRHELVDSRDSEALAELHGTTVEKREADLEPTKAKEKAKAGT